MALSRIGKQPVTVPKAVQVTVEGNTVAVKGPRGGLQRELPGVDIAVEGDSITLSPSRGGKAGKALHGLSRALLQNMVVGVAQGFRRDLEIAGVGYRADVKGDVLELTLGYSHPIRYRLPAGVSAVVEKQTKISLESTDKELLGRVAAKVRAFRAPDPYKAKGVKYADEIVRRKEGKTGGK